MRNKPSEIVTISPKYQVVIPKAIRRQFDLRPGQKVQVITYGDHLSFVPLRPMKTMRGFLKGIDPAIVREDDRF